MTTGSTANACAAALLDAGAARVDLLAIALVAHGGAEPEEEERGFREPAGEYAPREILTPMRLALEGFPADKAYWQIFVASTAYPPEVRLRARRQWGANFRRAGPLFCRASYRKTASHLRASPKACVSGHSPAAPARGLRAFPAPRRTKICALGCRFRSFYRKIAYFRGSKPGKESDSSTRAGRCCTRDRTLALVSAPAIGQAVCTEIDILILGLDGLSGVESVFDPPPAA